MAAVTATTVKQAGAAHQRHPNVLAWLVFAPLLAWLVAFVVVPTIVLVLLSFGEQKGLGTFHFTMTFDNYARAFHWTWLKVLLVSVWYAVLTTFLCVLIGYPAAFFIAGAPPRTRNILLTLVMIPFWTSFLVRTYSWIIILSKEGLVNAFLVSSKTVPEPVAILYTPFASVLGLVYNYLPFMILPIYASVERLDNAMIEAAYDLGAGPVRTFSQVIIPLTKPRDRGRRTAGLCSLDCHVCDHQFDGRRRTTHYRRSHLQTVHLRPQPAFRRGVGVPSANHFLCLALADATQARGIERAYVPHSSCATARAIDGSSNPKHPCEKPKSFAPSALPPIHRKGFVL
jgi:spermidine/putrescine transport system permease protein